MAKKTIQPPFLQWTGPKKTDPNVSSMDIEMYECGNSAAGKRIKTNMRKDGYSDNQIKKFLGSIRDPEIIFDGNKK